MGIRTLFRFLTGDREAILTIASTRRAWIVGLIFVLAAGFAREYDHEDLRREPWHLLLPLAASFTIATTLFLLVRVAITRTPNYPGFARAYGSFLTLFWMTAPMALLYAIPYDRFLSAGASVQANLWTLGLVATWRVLLMTRIIGVLTGAPVLSFFLIMAVADAAVLALLSQLKLPVINIMGGVRLTESEAIISSISFTLTALGILTAPVWFIGALVALFGRLMAWRPEVRRDDHTRISKPLIAVALVALLIWPILLPKTQAEQRLRRQAEDHFWSDDMAAVLTLMSAHAQHDFPPHWDPPPRPGYGDDRAKVMAVVEHPAFASAAPWVRAVYLEKLERYYLDGYSRILDSPETVRAHLAQISSLLDRLPEGEEIRKRRKADIRHLQEFAEEDMATTVPTSRPAPEAP